MSSDDTHSEVIEARLVDAVPATEFYQGALHPSSLVFESLSQIRQHILPVLFGLAGMASGNLWAVWIASGVFAVAFLVSVVRYLTLRYRIEGSDFIVTEGLLFRRVRSVPIERIQNLDLVQNVLQRIFDVAVVNIETASGTRPEATLRVLTKAQITELRTAIFGTNEAPLAQPSGVDLTNPKSVLEQLRSDVPVGHELILNASTKQLVLAGLTSNKGMVLIGILVGFYFQFEPFENAGRGAARDWMRSRFFFSVDEVMAEWGLQGGQWIVKAVVGIVLLLVLLRIVSVVWYMLRFHGYQLTRDGDDLRISCGLFTKVSATVPRSRIQFISVHRSFLRRRLGLASIRIETAGGAGTEQENAAATVSRRWFVPIITEGEVPRVLNELRADLCWSADEVAWQGVSPKARARLTRVAVMVSSILILTGALLEPVWGWLPGIVLFPAVLWIAFRGVSAKKYAQLVEGLVYQSGVFTKKMSFSFFDRIQTISLQQSPFDRRWDMARLLIDTAAAGPADHKIEVKYLEAEVAKSQFEELLRRASAHQVTWN